MNPNIYKLAIIVIYITAILLIYRQNKNTIILIQYYMNNLGILLSLILIENGSYISEQFLHGFDNGSFLIFSLFIFSSLVIIYKFNWLIIDIKYKSQKLLFYSITIILSIVLIFIISNNAGYSRFDIFKNLSPNVAKIMWLLIDAYSLVYIYSTVREKSIFIKLTYLASFSFVQYLRGSQFGGFLFAVIYFIISIVLHDQFQILAKTTQRYISKYQVSIGIVLGTIIFYFVVQFKISKLGNVFELYERMTLQGHMFWGTVNLLNEGLLLRPDRNAFFSHFFTFKSQATDISYGFGFLMNQVSPIQSVKLIEQGGRFTAGYPGIIILHFGYIAGYLIHILSTITYLYLFRIMYNIINTYHVVIFIVSMKFINFYINEYYFMGEYHDFFIRNIIALIVFYFLIKVYEQYRTRW